VNHWPQRTIVRVPFTFRDSITKVLVTPDSVEFSYQPGANAPFVGPFTWDGTNPTPGVNVIGQLSTGRFECQVNTMDFAGIVTCYIVSTGAGQGAQTRVFEIDAAPA
jgi:hypothetical protein